MKQHIPIWLVGLTLTPGSNPHPDLCLYPQGSGPTPNLPPGSSTADGNPCPEQCGYYYRQASQYSAGSYLPLDALPAIRMPQKRSWRPRTGPGKSKPFDVPWRDQPVTIGKINQINNFCIGSQGNENKCMSCHAGYGWEAGKLPKISAILKTSIVLPVMQIRG